MFPQQAEPMKGDDYIAAFDKVLSGIPALDGALDYIRMGKATVGGIIRARAQKKKNHKQEK